MLLYTVNEIVGYDLGELITQTKVCWSCGQHIEPTIKSVQPGTHLIQEGAGECIYTIRKGVKKYVFNFYDGDQMTVVIQELPDHPSIKKVEEYESAIRAAWNRYCTENDTIISLSMNRIMRLLPRVY